MTTAEKNNHLLCYITWQQKYVNVLLNNNYKLSSKI